LFNRSPGDKYRVWGEDIFFNVYFVVSLPFFDSPGGEVVDQVLMRKPGYEGIYK